MTNLNFLFFWLPAWFYQWNTWIGSKKGKDSILQGDSYQHSSLYCPKGGKVLINFITTKNNAFLLLFVLLFWWDKISLRLILEIFSVELGSIVFNLLLDHPCYYHNAAKDEEVFLQKLLNIAAFEGRKKEWEKTKRDDANQRLLRISRSSKEIRKVSMADILDNTTMKWRKAQ